MVVQHNLRAVNSNRMLGLTSTSQSKSTEKLSSGYKINRAADDAAGLAISEKMRKQIRGLTQASLNAQDGISAVQTAEGALTEVHDMLQRMNELAVKSANGTNSEDDRSYIQAEINQLVTEIDRVSTTTKFNETYLLKGDAAAGTKDVYSYKNVNVETPASATIKAGVNLFKADGTAITDEDALATYLKDNPNAKVYTNAGTEATATDYTDSSTYELKTGVVLYDATGAQIADGDELKTAVEGTGVFKDAGIKAVGGTDNVNPSINKLYDVNGDLAHDVGEDLSSLSNTDVEKFYTTAPTKATAADYTKNSAYALKAGTDIYDAEGKKLDAAGLTAALGKGDTVYTTAPVAATADDYTYTAASKGKAQLYDENGKAVSASNIADILDKGGKLYSDEAHITEANLDEYTSKKPVNGDLELSLHVGADSTDDNKISLKIASMSSASIGVDGLDVSTKDTATAAIDTISEALKMVSKQRSDLGAIQNRLEHTINNLDNVVENTTAAESQIRDTDMATEMVKYSNNNILAQAGQAMLAQSNQANQGVLSLLQ